MENLSAFQSALRSVRMAEGLLSRVNTPAVTAFEKSQLQEAQSCLSIAHQNFSRVCTSMDPWQVLSEMVGHHIVTKGLKNWEGRVYELETAPGDRLDVCITVQRVDHMTPGDKINELTARVKELEGLLYRLPNLDGENEA